MRLAPERLEAIRAAGAELGPRIHVIGNSCSGKSTLARSLAQALGLPLPLLILRMLGRSWRRWRTRELLWGTNYERFWPQLMVWRGEDSLLWWIVTQQQRKRRQMRAWMADPSWSHIRFLRLESTREVELLSGTVGASLAAAGAAD